MDLQPMQPSLEPGRVLEVCAPQSGSGSRSFTCVLDLVWEQSIDVAYVGQVLFGNFGLLYMGNMSH